jgi:hypothetical protein
MRTIFKTIDSQHTYKASRIKQYNIDNLPFIMDDATESGEEGKEENDGMLVFEDWNH